ncbi:tetratricopeptide repeat protein [Myroides injenensis]|uniref:tetratricopeptide repeat protein n=1 Tax=Myroides injenensis TaxID=1183151 RepID=UPI0002899ED7|nr:hypothetical protein [Myroides injenensis]
MSINRKVILLGALAIMSSTGIVSAQDLNDAKKAIQEEQFDKAKEILKTLVESKPNEGKNYYYLGNIYLKENQIDSAKYFFEQGIASRSKASLNYIGLGQIDLENGNISAAKANFTKAEKDIRKKDYDEQLLIAIAYLDASTPNALEAESIAKDIIEKDYQIAEAYLVLGKAYLLQDKVNEAFSAFSDAVAFDNSLLEAKMQVAIITKRARAFDQAIASFEEILKDNPNYAPAYREIADSYYLWSTRNASKAEELIGKSKENYKKYIAATDNAIEARMKYADFLLSTANYQELEKVANELKDVKGVSPRIYRYLGYAAFENKHYKESIQALEKYISEGKAKVIGRDYLYLGLANINGSSEVDANAYKKGLEYLQKAVQVEPAIAGAFNAYGVELFRNEKYQEAIDILSISAKVNEQPNSSYDNYYVAYCYYLLGIDSEKNQENYLNEADKYFNATIKGNPNIAEAYFFKARTNRYIDTEEGTEQVFNAYTGFINEVEKEAEVSSTNKDRLVEAYNSVATYYANKEDYNKAKEFFEKTLALEPSNEFAQNTLKAISK